MKSRAEGWGGFALRVLIAAAVLAVLCWLGMRMMPSQRLRLTLVALFALSVACGAFLPNRGSEAELDSSAQPKSKPEPEPRPEVEPRPEPRPEPEPQSRPEPQPETSPQPEPAIQPEPGSSTPVDGEEEYCRARVLVHQEIPDFQADGRYLCLLGESAEKGYARAMAKLGDYAMRRGTWVEAYYWMWRAQRAGQADVADALREILRNWKLDGFPSEEENIHDFFDQERGSIARALLDIATNHYASAARKYLKANHPELL